MSQHKWATSLGYSSRNSSSLDLETDDSSGGLFNLVYTKFVTERIPTAKLFIVRAFVGLFRAAYSEIRKAEIVKQQTGG